MEVLEIMKDRPRTLLSYFLPALVLLLTAPTTGRAQSIESEPSLANLAGLVSDLLSQEPEPRVVGDQTVLMAPRSGPLTGPISWLALKGTVGEMEAFLTAAPVDAAAPFTALGLDSLRQAKRALEKRVQLDTDFAGAMRHLGLSVHLMEIARDLTQDPARQTFARETLDGLAESARLLATEGIERAIAADIDPALISAAQAALDDGLILVGSGNYSEAIPFFNIGNLAGNVPVLDLGLFEQNIRDSLSPRTVGYSYAIAQNGILVAEGGGMEGLARTAADGGPVNQNATKEMNIASLAKTITAMTVVQLLVEKNIPVDSSISPWLPSSWPQDESIQNLTFRNLMTQRSGLNKNGGCACGQTTCPSNNDYNSLKGYIMTGVNAPQCYAYQNANFALFRIIIPSLHYGRDTIDTLADGFPSLGGLDGITQVLYKHVVRLRVFDKTGFVRGDCDQNDSNPTLLYTFPDDGNPGVDPGSWTSICGAGGWYLSARELAGILAYRRFTNLILTPQGRDLMDSNFLGWLDPADLGAWGNGDWGLYRNHGGDLPYPGNKGVGSCWMEFPFGVQAAILINSRAGTTAIGPVDLNGDGINDLTAFGSNHQCGVLTNAFDRAWVSP